jgi:hypothetical protein
MSVSIFNKFAVGPTGDRTWSDLKLDLTTYPNKFFSFHSCMGSITLKLYTLYMFTVYL